MELEVTRHPGNAFLVLVKEGLLLVSKRLQRFFFCPWSDGDQIGQAASTRRFGP
jgi:hypothetical protein